jgi:hypothetical protein
LEKIIAKILEGFQILPFLLTTKDTNNNQKTKFSPIGIVAFLIQAFLIASLVFVAMYYRYERVIERQNDMLAIIAKAEIERTSLWKEVKDLRIDLTRIDAIQQQRLEKERNRNR